MRLLFIFKFWRSVISAVILSALISACQGQQVPSELQRPQAVATIDYIPTEATTTPTSTRYVGVGQ